MKKSVVFILSICGVISLAFAADTFNTWQPLQGATYKIFSGDTVAYSEAPTAKDRKLSLVVRGQAAKEIFDSIGPDERDMCSTAKGDRERNKGAVQCMYTAKDAYDPTVSYRCWIGVDLRSGKGIPTVSC
jgi:hypothetical protein